MAKRITFKVLNADELEKAYPEIVKRETIQTVQITIDKQALYEIVKLNVKLARDTPGVDVTTPADTEEDQAQ